MDALDIAGPKLNAVRARNAQALTIADAMDKGPKSSRGPLFCIPVVKDNIDTADMPTTDGSRLPLR
jgi:Asp-tRNA(Asn)/Glu-tRNA(Gln) amidotransferase A subunit family amidase